MNDDKFLNLHIYAQHDCHGDAFIMGSHEALTKLRDIIDLHLKTALPVGDDSFVTKDGEGYTIMIDSVNPECFEQLKLPYTSFEYDFSSPESGQTAYQAMGSNTYTRIHKMLRERRK